MPTIDFNLLSDQRDFDRLMIAVQRILRALSHPAMRNAVNECFMPAGGHANALNRPTRMNFVKSWVASRLFDGGSTMRRRLLHKYLVDPAALAADPDALAVAIQETAAGVHHPTGTCRMGRETDPDAVTDPQGRVYGIGGLRVADASLMPTIVTAGTHLTAVMIGEKIADTILTQGRA
jgi:5-(hydroxymethyl)furfural/furfural oxidase